jgi:uncharacterized protein (DUF2336 family)
MTTTMTTATSLIDELEQALTSGSFEQRIQTLARVTDLFVAGAASYSEEQVGLFDDVILRIATRIEAKALARLSSLLAPIRNAPIKVAKALAFHDDIDVAQPMLRLSERLDEQDLIAHAQTKSQQHLLAIAERARLSEAVTDVLVERGDREVVRSVARNRGARFSDTGFHTLVHRASGDDALATDVGMRRDLPPHHMLKLIEKASIAVREKLTVANPQAARAVKEVLADVAAGMRDEMRNASPDYAAAKAKVATLYRSGVLAEAELYQFARERRFEETAVTLALMCAVPIDVVERALLDQRTEIALILAKVAGLSWTTAKAILLIRAADRGVSAQDLELAMNNFTRLQPESARRVLGFYQSRRKNGTEAFA